jgi:hypothetical protein
MHLKWESQTNINTGVTTMTCSDKVDFVAVEECMKVDFTDTQTNSVGGSESMDRYNIYFDGTWIAETSNLAFPGDGDQDHPELAFNDPNWSSSSTRVEDVSPGSHQITFDFAEHSGANNGGEAWIRLYQGVSSGVCGDPHFVGFNGEGYDFMGEPDEYYNIITSERFQLNAHFAKTVLADGHVMESEGELLTLVDEVGIQVNGHKVFFSVNGTAQVDGEDIALDTIMPLGDGAYLGFRKGNKFDDALGSSVPKNLRQKWFGDEVHTPEFVGTVGLFGMVTTFYTVTTPRLPGVTFMDMDFFRPSYFRNYEMHGIVGQTNQGSVEERGVFDPVEGVDADYQVSDIWGTDFEANLF